MISDLIPPLYLRSAPPRIPPAPHQYRVHLSDNRAIDVFAASPQDAAEHKGKP